MVLHLLKESMFHINLKKAFNVVQAIEQAMEASGLHVHGLSGLELGQITAYAISTGKTIAEAVKILGFEIKAAVESPAAE